MRTSSDCNWVGEAAETDEGLAIKGRFDLGTEHGMAAYGNTKGRRVSGLSIGYAIRNSTKTAAGNELTDLRHDSPQLCAFTPSPSTPYRRWGLTHQEASARSRSC